MKYVLVCYEEAHTVSGQEMHFSEERPYDI